MSNFPELKENRLITFDLDDRAIEWIHGGHAWSMHEPDGQIEQADDENDDPHHSMNENGLGEVFPDGPFLMQGYVTCRCGHCLQPSCTLKGEIGAVGYEFTDE